MIIFIETLIIEVIISDKNLLFELRTLNQLYITLILKLDFMLALQNCQVIFVFLWKICQIWLVIFLQYKPCLLNIITTIKGNNYQIFHIEYSINISNIKQCIAVFFCKLKFILIPNKFSLFRNKNLTRLRNQFFIACR